ncbi:conserved hypothetical protein [Thermosulfidibacter takaii ABI70S6]|uniref:Flagellin n=1 Tax=Thermosulfidibacter takaii (strain DSM 17441 / JCM 13301 / NBRC 103674 / ABI70S6) TaxID=1298851 RepID=A0A0S3QRL1_THET7|nr:flagellin [Thermosulfidibacter takaii]BAT70971.1 conserved hypothetical protein [Thermosulfidibacter takaii ABI70S6]
MLNINNNIPALFASNALDNIVNSLNKTIQRLATGKRIITASDDPGSTHYLSRLKALQIGWHKAQQNIFEAQDLLNTAQYALSGISGIKSVLYRMRELALEAANTATLTSQDLRSIQEEIESLVEEVDRISLTTEYNTRKLLDGSLAGKITSTTPYIFGYVTGKVENATLSFSNAQAATKGIVKVQAPLPESQRMPTSLDDTYDYTKQLGEAQFIADTSTAAAYQADYDIIFTPGNPDYDFIVYEASTGATVGTGQFGVPFTVSSNNNVSITINSGSQTIQEGYKGIWHVDTDPTKNYAAEGNLAYSATITIGHLSDTAMINGEIIIEIDWVNNQLSYRAIDTEGTPLGAWVPIGETFYAYENSKIGNSYFTLNITNPRPGFENIAGKGDKWKIYFKEYDTVTSNGTLLLEIDGESYAITWSAHETLENLKNTLNDSLGNYVEVEFDAEGGTQVLTLKSLYPGSMYVPQIRDLDGNLAQALGFYQVEGTGQDAIITIENARYGPQSSNIFIGVAQNVVIVLSEEAQNLSGTITVRDLSQKVAATPTNQGNINFYIPPVNSMILGLKDWEGNILIDVTKPDGAEKAINTVDEAIDTLSLYETHLGAVYKRLEKALSLAQQEETTTTSSISHIEDADIAEELVKLTTLEIKRDTTAAMLAHANLEPQRIWKILFEAGKD